MSHAEHRHSTNDPDDALAEFSREELADMIRKMLRRHPDLEVVLYGTRALQQASHTGESTVHAEDFRKRAERAILSCDNRHDWRAARHIADSLDPIIDIGDNFLQCCKVLSAAAVYHGVAQAIMAYYGEIHDECEVATEFGRCIAGLLECLCAILGADVLSELPDDLPNDHDLYVPGARNTIFQACTEILFWNAEAGYCIGDDMPHGLIEHVTSEEKATLIALFRERMERQAKDYPRRQYAELLLTFEGEVDDETFIERAKIAGHLDQAVERLLSLGRTEEALAAVASMPYFHLPEIAPLFIKCGCRAQILDIVKKQLNDRHTFHILGPWLREQYTKHGETEPALDLTWDVFEDHPSLEEYKRLRTLALQCRRWEEIKERATAMLRASEQQWGRGRMLIDIHLLEEEWKDAIAVARRMQHASAAEDKVHVARQVKHVIPEDALSLLQESAIPNIERRSRPGYKEACEYLQEARDIARKMGKEDEWNAFLRQLLQRYPTLHAFHKEVRTASLLQPSTEPHTDAAHPATVR